MAAVSVLVSPKIAIEGRNSLMIWLKEDTKHLLDGYGYVDYVKYGTDDANILARINLMSMRMQ